MQLRISNLAWDNPDEFFRLVKARQVSCVELAPTKIWPKLEDVTESQCRDFLVSAALRGLRPAAFQALLFGCPELQFFQAPKPCLERLETVMKVAQGLGVRILVFGSPKNRLLTNESREHVLHVCEQAGNLARDHGCLFCIEPNPPIYGGNWAMGLADTTALLRELNHPAVRLHADTGAMLENEEKVPQLEETFDLLVSCHMSLPGLKPLIVATAPERQLIRDVMQALRQAPHLDSVGLEMMRAENFEALEKNVSLFIEMAA
jgi:D-psicose/D-tagatose/L-ribulose 3-epimerase